jgi:hypothetical protein
MDQKRALKLPTFWSYLIIYFILFVGCGEILCRSIEQDYPSLSHTGYTPAIKQYQRFTKYVEKNGAPDV